MHSIITQFILTHLYTNPACFWIASWNYLFSLINHYAGKKTGQGCIVSNLWLIWGYKSSKYKAFFILNLNYRVELPKEKESTLLKLTNISMIHKLKQLDGEQKTCWPEQTEVEQHATGSLCDIRSLWFACKAFIFLETNAVTVWQHYNHMLTGLSYSLFFCNSCAEILDELKLWANIKHRR